MNKIFLSLSICWEFDIKASMEKIRVSASGLESLFSISSSGDDDAFFSAHYFLNKISTQNLW